MFKFLLLPAACLALACTLPLHAADTAQSPPVQAKKAPAGAPIYGSQLMTAQERDEYRAKMRSAKTQAERDRIRAEHHAAMQERAKEKGVTLPDQPRGPQRGQGAGPGKGPGPGPGPGR